MTERHECCMRTHLPRRTGPASAERSRPTIRDVTWLARIWRCQALGPCPQRVCSLKGAVSGQGRLGTSHRHRLSMNSAVYDSWAHRCSPSSVRTLRAEGHRSRAFEQIARSNQRRGQLAAHKRQHAPQQKQLQSARGQRPHGLDEPGRPKVDLVLLRPVVVAIGALRQPLVEVLLRLHDQIGGTR